MWYAIYTKPAKEDSVALRLQKIGIDVINPKLKSRKFVRKKFDDVIEPLFPCYVFANFDKDKYAHLITYTRGVRYIVGKRNPIVVHNEIIDSIKQNMHESNIIVLKTPEFQKGDKVLIREGPFRDFHGIFEKEVRGRDRVLILLEAIHYKLEIDSCTLSAA